MRRRLLPVVLVLCTVGFAAAPAAAGEEDDEKIAKRAELKASDLPDGWESERSEESDTGIPECEATDRADARADRKPSARSPEFSDPDAPRAIRSVTDSVWVFPTVKAAKRFFRVFESEALTECLFARGDEIADQLGFPEPTIEGIDLTGTGDDAVGYSVLVGDGNPVNTIYLEVILVRVGRAATGFTAQNLGASLPEGPDILDAVVGRLERAL